MKRVVILQHNGGRMANQLWSFISIYAYCLERGYECVNSCFFEYNTYFGNITTPRVGRLMHACMKGLRSIVPHRLARRCVYAIYGLYVFWVRRVHAWVVTDQERENEANFYVLPPTKESTGRLRRWEEQSSSAPIYVVGWRFRNTLGLQKFHAGIVAAFKPKARHAQAVQAFMDPLRAEGRMVVGVHIRHGDYKNWNNGRYFFTFAEVRTILDSFVRFAQHNGKEVLFVICSDATVDDAVFQGLPFVHGLGTEVEDLFILAATDTIIGAQSTYGTLAAYLGNVPFYTFSREPMRWEESSNIFLI